MAKVVLYNEKLEFKPIIALLKTDDFEVKLFYRMEELDKLREYYINFLPKRNYNIIAALLLVREKMVMEYFMKIIDWLSDNYAIESSDVAKFYNCDQTLYFTFDDLLLDINEEGIQCKLDYNNLYLSEEKYLILNKLIATYV